MKIQHVLYPPDEIFQLNNEYNQDTRKEKINGGIGVYLDDRGQPYVLPAVKKAFSLLSKANFNYLPISGDVTFLDASLKLALGNNLYTSLESKIARQGVAGGTNGLFIWGSFVKQIDPHPTLILSAPTWENHKKIFAYLGFKIVEYNHVAPNHRFDLDSCIRAVVEHPQGYVLLHGGPTHNPTGINPDQRQWRQLVDLLQRYHCHALFDFAYMGLGENVDKDSLPIRLTVSKGLSVSIVISYSKNMTLYQHRTGALFISTKNEKERQTAESRLKHIFRIVNSNPPGPGELVVKTILTSQELKEQWLAGLQDMVHSLTTRRKLFVKHAGDQFRHIMNQKGLFSLLNLSKQQVSQLKNKHGIYLLSNSRLNFGGLSLENAAKVAGAILEETTSSTI